ncbi:MAG: YlxR family protein [Cyanobacteria bacterium P01_G01_bin.54]
MQKNYRRCVACRKVATKADFWRIVRLHPSRTVQLEEGMGRSAYLCPQMSCLRTAQKKDRLGRSLKTNVPDEIYHQLWLKLNASLPP